MNKLLLIILIICVAVFLYKNKNNPQLKFVNVSAIKTTLTDYKVDQSPQIDQCLSKKYCVLAYVAPWCPACHAFIQQYPALKNKLTEKQIEILFVVGADEIRSKEVALKEELGENAVLDTLQGDFRKLNQIDFFPYLIVTEASNKVLAAGHNANEFINSILN